MSFKCFSIADKERGAQFGQFWWQLGQFWRHLGPYEGHLVASCPTSGGSFGCLGCGLVWFGLIWFGWFGRCGWEVQ